MNKYYTGYSEIEQVLEDYFAAVERADIDALKTIFHESASMYGYLGKDAVIGTPQIFYDDIGSKPSMKESSIKCTYVIKSIDVVGEIAQACIVVDNFYGAACVEDKFQLMKIEGKWYIMSKLFTVVA